ncbi:MAG: hypothetical protein ACI9KE_005550 [Polyangiales bacterium]|jgi:hypothetical protein
MMCSASVHCVRRSEMCSRLPRVFRRLWISAALCTLFACGAVRPSFDEAPRVTTSVRVTDSPVCRIEGVLRDSVAEGLGSVSFTPNAASMIRVDVRLAESAMGWRGRIEVRGSDDMNLGQRTLDLAAGSCDDARSSLSFILAMLVETPAVTNAVEEAQAQPEPSERVVRLGVLGGASLGRTPAVAGFVGLSGALSWPHFDLRVEARALLPGEEKAMPGFRVWGAELAVLACPTLNLGESGALGLCGGIRGGILRSEGIGFSPNIATVGGLADATLSLRPALRVGRFSLGVEVVSGVSLVRPEFAFRQGTDLVRVYEPSRFWGELSLFTSFSL